MFYCRHTEIVGSETFLFLHNLNCNGLDSIKYKVGVRGPTIKKNLHNTHEFFAEYSDDITVIECYPFLGGQYQERLSIFIDQEQGVEIS